MLQLHSGTSSKAVPLISSLKFFANFPKYANKVIKTKLWAWKTSDNVVMQMLLVPSGGKSHTIQYTTLTT